MEAVGAQAAENKKERRARAAIKYPGYDLGNSVLVAKAIHEKGGGVASRDQLAAFLDYKTTNSGAFLSRIGAARLFNLIENRDGGQFTITPLAQRILMPVYPEQARAALVEAFRNVPLYEAIYQSHQGRELPPEFGFKNLLRTQYGIAADATGSVINNLMESADLAGFFATRGTRTHLIMPNLQGRPADHQNPAQEEDGDGTGGSGSGGGTGDGSNGFVPPPSRRSREDLQNEYIAVLLDAFKAKLEQGQMDAELGEKIEKLVGLSANA